MIRSALFAASAYHFEGQTLDLALSVAFTGYSAGWIVVTPLASYLFSEFSFNKAMLVISPIMLVHLMGVVFYSQDNTKVRKENRPDSKPLRESLKIMFSEINVSFVFVLVTFQSMEKIIGDRRLLFWFYANTIFLTWFFYSYIYLIRNVH